MSYVCFSFFFFFKQKTAYEIRKGDWSSDVCSSDLQLGQRAVRVVVLLLLERRLAQAVERELLQFGALAVARVLREEAVEVGERGGELLVFDRLARVGEQRADFRWLVGRHRLVGAARRVEGYARDLRNAQHGADHERLPRRQVVRLPDHLAARTIAVVALGERGERVARADRVRHELDVRSEERRVGKECPSLCRSRW